MADGRGREYVLDRVARGCRDGGHAIREESSSWQLELGCQPPRRNFWFFLALLSSVSLQRSARWHAQCCSSRWRPRRTRRWCVHRALIARPAARATALPLALIPTPFRPPAAAPHLQSHRRFRLGQRWLAPRRRLQRDRYAQPRRARQERRGTRPVLRANPALRALHTTGRPQNSLTAHDPNRARRSTSTARRRARPTSRAATRITSTS